MMLLEAISAVSRPSSRGSSNLAFLQDLTNPNAISTVPSPCLNPFTSSFSPSRLSLSLASRRDKGFAASASNETESLTLTDLVFQSFEEVKKDEFMVPIAPHGSLARQGYSKECEDAIMNRSMWNTVFYVNHSLYAYFDRDNVDLKGLSFSKRPVKKKENMQKNL